MKVYFHSLKLFLVPWWLSRLRNTWKFDVIAGLSVAIVAIPQSMGYAQLAGLPPYYGLYAIILPTIVAAYFGTSRFVSTGPVAIVAILTATAVSSIAQPDSSEYIAYVAMLALIVGLIQLALGALKLGSLIRYVARPIVAGFVSAAAIIILLSQLHLLLGISSDGVSVYDRLIAIITMISTAHIPTIIAGVGSLVAILVIRHVYPRVPAVLVVVATGTLLSWLAGYSGDIIGQIPSGFPTISLPSNIVSTVPSLFLSALVIAIVGYMEGFSVIKSFSSKTHDKIMPNKEMLAQGLSNVCSSISGTMPVAGSVSRTALTYATGAKTNFASIALGIAAFITLLFLTPLFFYMPIATLAAVIVVAVIRLIDINELVAMYKAYPQDGIVAFVTFFSTLIFTPHIDYGIIVGIAVSIIMLLYRSSNPRVSYFWLGDKKHYESGYFKFKKHPDNKYVAVVSWDASLTFANAGTFEDIMYKAAHMPHRIRYIILLGRGINTIDATGQESMENVIRDLHKRNIAFYISGLTPGSQHAIQSNGLSELIKEESLFAHAHDALLHVYSEEKINRKQNYNN